MTFRVFIFALSLSGMLSAQEPVRKIAVSFYAFDYARGHETVHIRSEGGGYEAIRLSKANIVGPHTALVAGSTLSIHGETAGVDGESARPVLSTVAIRADIGRALVVCLPDPANPPYRFLVFGHDDADFPLGVYRLINLSPHPIRGAIAREVVQAKPGGIANLEPRGDPGTVAPVRFEFFNDGRWNRLTETRCAIRHDRRWLMCIYRDPATGRMNIRTIPDRTLLAAPASPD